MSMHITPNICVQFTPDLRVLVDGCDVTRSIKAHASVQLGRLGRLVGRTRDAFAFGLDETGATPKDVRDPEKLKVRISNLEWMNENLRENNRALLATNESLRDVVAKLSNPVITVGGPTT